MSWIQTYTGRKVTPLNMIPDQVDLRDVSHSLSQTARFRGHARFFYSVAQHSYEVACHVHPLLAGAALLHDAAEAYLFDAPRPIKGLIRINIGQGDLKADEDLVWFDEIEEKILRTIFEGLRVSWPSEEGWKEIHEADIRMLMTEKRDLLAPEPEPWAVKAEPYPKKIIAWSWAEARIIYQDAFEMLMGRRIP